MINRILVLFCLLFIYYSFSIAKAEIKKNGTLPVDTIKAISDIKKQYLEVNSNEFKYSKYEKRILGKSTEGETVVSYYDVSVLKKIVTIQYGEMGKTVSEYYFNNNCLFFVFKSDYHYNQPIYFKGSKVTFIEENRYYLYKTSLIRWIDKNKNRINPNSGSFKDEELILLKEAKEILSICNLH